VPGMPCSRSLTRSVAHDDYPAAAIMPLFSTRAGLTPKNAGIQMLRSASFPTSIEPKSFAMSCAIAGLMVDFASFSSGGEMPKRMR